MAEHRSDDGIFKFMTGIFFGLLAGFAAGALLVDKSGKELRKDISLNSEEVMHNLKEKFADFKDIASEQIKDLKGMTDERFKTSAINLEEKVHDLACQLDELTQKGLSHIDKEKAQKN